MHLYIWDKDQKHTPPPPTANASLYLGQGSKAHTLPQQMHLCIWDKDQKYTPSHSTIEKQKQATRQKLKKNWSRVLVYCRDSGVNELAHDRIVHDAHGNSTKKSSKYRK